jgi:hypothetical protein
MPSLLPDSRLVIRDVNTSGWHAAVVDPHRGHHGWAFTIGFTQTFAHPEVVVFGLPADVLRAVLDAIGCELRAGRMFADGEDNAILAPPYRCVFRDVDAAWRDLVLPGAAWFYGGRPFSALQLVWPDRGHRFPWETEFDPDLIAFQPLLFHAEAAAARVAAFLDRDIARG